MPLYEYVCKDCGQHFDALRSIKDADKPIQCRSCHGENITRAMSVFYATSGGHPVTSTAGGCGGCSGGSCASCGSNN